MREIQSRCTYVHKYITLPNCPRPSLLNKYYYCIPQWSFYIELLSNVVLKPKTNSQESQLNFPLTLVVTILHVVLLNKYYYSTYFILQRSNFILYKNSIRWKPRRINKRDHSIFSQPLSRYCSVRRLIRCRIK